MIVEPKDRRYRTNAVQRIEDLSLSPLPTRQTPPPHFASRVVHPCFCFGVQVPPRETAPAHLAPTTGFIVLCFTDDRVAFLV